METIFALLPATLHPGITVVICPLLSLIQDQIFTLNDKYGIAATFLNSQQTASQSFAVIQELRKERPSCKLLYVTPERIAGSMSFMDILRCLHQKARQKSQKNESASAYASKDEPTNKSLTFEELKAMDQIGLANIVIFGNKTFRPLQYQACKAAMENKDCFVLMPTSGASGNSSSWHYCCDLSSPFINSRSNLYFE